MVGSGCSLGANRGFDPWPLRGTSKSSSWSTRIPSTSDGPALGGAFGGGALRGCGGVAGGLRGGGGVGGGWVWGYEELTSKKTALGVGKPFVEP